MRQIYRRHRRTRVGACRACRGARDRVWPVSPPARGGELRIPDPSPPLREEPLGVRAGELLRPHPRRRVARRLRRHRHRPAAHRGSLALRHPALQLLRLRRHPGNAARTLRRLLRNGDPSRAGAQCGPVPRRGGPPHPSPSRHRGPARRAVHLRRGPRHSPAWTDRRVRQFRQHGAGAPRAGGVRIVHARRRLLPQLLRHAEGRGRGERRRPGAAATSISVSRWRSSSSRRTSCRCCTTSAC